MRDDGLLYFLQVVGNGPVKAGYSGDVNLRMRSLQNFCPYELAPLLAIRASKLAEFFVLETLKPYRIRGEWFDPHPFVFNFIESIRVARAVPGVPAEFPAYNHWTHEARINYEALVPSIWESREALAAAVGLKVVQDGVYFSPQVVCRICMAARKVGRNLLPTDVAHIVKHGSRKARLRKTAPYKLRTPKATVSDFIIETHGVDSALPTEASAA